PISRDQSRRTIVHSIDFPERGRVRARVAIGATRTEPGSTGLTGSGPAPLPRQAEQRRPVERSSGTFLDIQPHSICLTTPARGVGLFGIVNVQNWTGDVRPPPFAGDAERITRPFVDFRRHSSVTEHPPRKAETEV